MCKRTRAILKAICAACCVGPTKTKVQERDNSVDSDSVQLQLGLVKPAAAPTIVAIPFFVEHLDQAQGKPARTCRCHELLAHGKGKVIDHDVVVKKGLCLNEDVCVHGSVHVLAGASCCINGNIAIAGDLTIEAGADVCLSGSALVVGNVQLASNTCVSGAAHVKGTLTVTEANLDVSEDLKVEGETHFQAHVNPE